MRLDFRRRTAITWRWFTTHPIAMINTILALIAIMFFVYLMTKPIDVLADWSVRTTRQGVNGEPPVYNPGGSLEFVSTSRKLISAEGQTSRMFDCDATGTQKAREIQLDKLTANRAPGYNPPRENSITVPGVTAFNGLPRTCRIVFNVCYDNVILWRDHCETASTNDFYVKEDELDAASIREQIQELTDRIHQLESQLSAYEGSASTDQNVAYVPTGQSTTVVTVAPSAPSPSASPTPTPSVSPSPSPTPAVSPRPCLIGLLGLCILGST